MKKIFTSTLLALIFLTQPGLCCAESQSFQLVVVIPAMAQMTHDIMQLQHQSTPIFIAQGGTQIVQEQKMVRGQDTILVRSIVVL